jgi:hypothetical protein
LREAITAQAARVAVHPAENFARGLVTGTTLAVISPGAVGRGSGRPSPGGFEVTSRSTSHRVEEGQPRAAAAGYSYAVRSKAFVPLLGLLVAAVLALAVASLRYERDRLMGDFGVSQQETAEQLVADLEQELADLDDDGRLVSTLLSRARTRPSLDAADGNSFLLAGFQAPWSPEARPW